MKLTSQAVINGKWAFKLAWARARRFKAIPRTSLSPKNRQQILAMYIKAQYMNLSSHKKYEVDHIIPLYHPDVCGLHCVSNLQILDKATNQAKGNKFAPYREKNGRKYSYTVVTFTKKSPKIKKTYNRTKKNPLKLAKKKANSIKKKLNYYNKKKG